jgi:hypothetical protein
MKPQPQYYRTDLSHRCATLSVTENTGLADPCYVIPDHHWSEFLGTMYAAGGTSNSDDAVFVFKGVPFHCWRTGGDGMFKGVAVDTGTLCKFPLNMAQAKFDLQLLPLDD